VKKPERHIFICTSSRIGGAQKGFCHTKGGVDIMAKFLEEIEERELDGQVAVTGTGCFGICDKGPIVVVYPDNVWYGSVTTADVEEIIDKHIEGGQVVTRLAL
jgi:(2Fe-2S) ferredoxin